MNENVRGPLLSFLCFVCLLGLGNVGISRAGVLVPSDSLMLMLSADVLCSDGVVRVVGLCGV